VLAYGGTDGGGTALHLVGKRYVDAARAERAHGVLCLLDGARTDGWRVPRPVALVPSLSLSLQQRAAGETVDDLHGAERARAVRLAGAWLARLHTLDLTLDRSLKLESELRKIAEWAVLVATAEPSCGPASRELACRLSARLPGEWPAGRAPTHKDFHFQHVLVDGDACTVVDLDEVRNGDPSFDVAHFCAYLSLLALRDGSAGCGELEAEFLDGYGSAARGPVHELFRGYACLKIAKQLVTGRGPTPVPAGAELLRQLRLALDTGLAGMGA
jgi:aminoglycoside phosphotransferase (APT) family kinase protein